MEFDYVIVGGGAAGCVLANRLSEDRNVQVALVEAGPDRRSIRWMSRIPLAYVGFMAPALAWMGGPKFMSWFETEPEPGLQGRQIALPRGHGMGGSTSVNGQIFIRGQREDFDHWRDDLGCPGLGVRRPAAVFPEARDVRGAGEPQECAAHDAAREAAERAGRPEVSRHGRAGERRAGAERQPDDRCVPRGGGAGGTCADGRLQRREAGRVRLLHVHPQERRAAFGRGRLYRSNPASAEPHHPCRSSDDEGADGGEAGRGGRVGQWQESPAKFAGAR